MSYFLNCIFEYCFFQKKRLKMKKYFILFLFLSGDVIPVMAATVVAPPSSASRTIAYSYQVGNGLLSTVTIEPDRAQLRLDASFKYDAWGNGVVTTVSSPAIGNAAITARESHSLFDSRGQFSTGTVNPLSQSENFTFDSSFGVVSKIVDVNGIATEFKYDSFGRKIMVVGADGNRKKLDYKFCSGVNDGAEICPMYAKYMLQETALASDGLTVNGGWSKFYYDELDREVAVERPGFDGISVIVINTEYDERGRISRISRPYYKGAQVYWNVTSYDDVNRVSMIVNADGSKNTYSYNGLNSSSRNAADQVRINTTNLQGKLSKLIDDEGNEFNYQYSVFGDLWKTIDSKSNVISIAYDDLGRKIQIDDPDMGARTFVNDALGQLVLQVDAKGQSSSFSYDKLGRLLSRREVDLVSSWSYDSCAKGVGKLCKITANNGYSETLSYDQYGRKNVSNKYIDAAYVETNSFDMNGRMNKRTFPDGLTLRYDYTQNGYLKEVRDNDTNVLYWQAQNLDSEGNFLKQIYGNNIITTSEYNGGNGRVKNIYGGTGNGVQNLAYDFDAIGNIVSRTDKAQGLTESFLYDGLNRLRTSTVNSSGAGLLTQSYEYDSIGNIYSRSGVGKYIYDTAPRILPHAVGTIELSSGGSRRFEYDMNGNLIKDFKMDASGKNIPAAERTIFYNSFDMPARIVSAGGVVDFLYDANHMRIKETSSSATTIYVHPGNGGDLYYEKEIKKDGSVEHRQFISVAGVVIAVVKKNSGIQSTNYFHRDYLGSVVAISDGAGTVIERLAYEPFGKRRYVSGLQDANGQIRGVNSVRGFTNHQHLDDLELIHMNGRVYDPIIARFISADPTITNPTDLQSFNRYSYAIGNPLAFVDPSGFTEINMLDQVVNIEGTKLSMHFTAPVNSLYIMSLDGFSWTVAGWDTIDPEGMPIVGIHARKDRASTSVAQTTINGTRDFMDGGYGAMSQQAFSSGRYGLGSAYILAGAAFGTLNVLSFGEAGALVSASRAIGAKAGSRYVAGNPVRVTEKGLALVEKNLARFESYGPNEAMVSGLRESLKAGEKASGAYADFYLHEIAENTLRMGKIDPGYDAAHKAALLKYGVSEFNLYSEKVIRSMPGEFNKNFKNFWGIK
ncbi:RHS repeat domain-containing protein [Janthinobacterium aestuarii]